MHIISFEFLPSPDSISDTLESCEKNRVWHEGLHGGKTQASVRWASC